MKKKSFRLRLALFSALLAGGSVTGFSGISYLFYYQSKLRSLDFDIQDQLLIAVSTPRPVFYWEELAESRSELFKNHANLAGELLILANDNRILYHSPNWHKEFNRKLFFPPQPDIPEEFKRDFPLTPTKRENLAIRALKNPDPFNRQQNHLPSPIIRSELSSLITLNTASGTWRIGTISSPFVRMAIAVNLKPIDREMMAIRNIFFILIPITLLLVMLGAWWLSGDALKSLKQIIEIIKKVTAKELNQRASIEDLDDEFIELVQVFNQMMDRLERSFQQASRFSADAAHELKTPLAILQGELERAVQKTKVGSELQQTFSNLLDEVCRLNAITRKLLLLSLADAGKMSIKKEKINLTPIIQDLAEDIDLIDPDLDVKINIKPQLYVQGDRDLITQVLQNLVTNAIKYNAKHNIIDQRKDSTKSNLQNGWIEIKSKQKNNTIFIYIANSSKDLSMGDRQHIFDRFQRGDASRNRKIEGFGLGLNLSREIIRAHGGNLYLDEPSPGRTGFILSLPLDTTVT